MNTKGIRILDETKQVSSVSLIDLLSEIEDGSALQWLVTFFYATGDLDDGTSTTELERDINESEQGLFLTWPKLIEFAQKYVGLRDITLIGASVPSNLLRYAQNAAMYEACNIAIEKVDSEYWEVFAKNPTLLEKLAKKFECTEPLEPDFLQEE